MLFTAKSRRRAKLATTALRPQAAKAMDLLLLAEMMAAGTLQPVIGRRYPLAEMADAHRHVETGHKVGALVIEVVPADQGTQAD
ncbi:MAG TPA: zinc-binding dehydrogenase [Devosiaceae bacterium]|nr:zinc-binding dehydrogenase [Devosiaceae bacterium]